MTLRRFFWFRKLIKSRVRVATGGNTTMVHDLIDILAQLEAQLLACMDAGRANVRN